MRVAMLGTGIMGAAMARNLAAAGHEVRAWNRSVERAQALEGDGVRAVGEPGEALRDAEVAVTMLADGRAVLDTMGAALEAGAPADVVWVQASTIGLEDAEACARLAAEHAVAFVDAPVVGTRQPAEAGELIVLAAGPDDALDRCGPVLDAVARQVTRVGDAPEATRRKLVVNHWILSLVEATAETVAFAEALGVDPRAWLEAIEGGPLDVPYAQTKGSAIIERALEPSFRLALARKDAGLALDAAQRHGMEAALMGVVAERMDRAIAAGHGDEDMAATYFGSAGGAHA